MLRPMPFSIAMNLRPPLLLAATHHEAHRMAFTLIMVLALGAALVLGLILNHFFRRFRGRSGSAAGVLAFSLLESLTLPLLVLTTLYSGMEVLTPPPRVEHLLSKLIFALVVTTIFYFLAKSLILVLHLVGQREPTLVRVTQPAVFVIRVLFVILAAIIVLENLGIHLTAVWTTLGVGSVAIALALQETLSNLFAGLYIMADRPINAGDYVKLDSGHEGYVLQIGWRATSIRSLANNVVFVPNSSLAKATITNYSLPEERMALGIPVSVSYNTDPKHLESVLLEAVKEAMHDGVPGLLQDPAPTVTFIPGFGASSLDFSLNVQIRRYQDQYSVQSEVRRRILDHCNRARIEMPFPTRTLVLDKSVLDLLSNGQNRPQSGQAPNSKK